nr:hypothetical protein [Tanacetum cinerariifolium]
SVGTARQACLSTKLRMRTEYCMREKKRLESEFEKQTGLLKSQDEKIENLKAQLLLKEAESTKVALLPLKQMLSSSLLNVEFGVEAMATLSFVTSFVSATPEREGGVPADSITRSVVVPPVMSEAVITTHFASGPFATALEPGTKVITHVHVFVFHDFESTGMVRPDVAGSSHFPGKELSIRSQEVGSESLHEVFVLRWNIPNDSLLDNMDASKEFTDHLAPPVLFAQIRDKDYDELFMELVLALLARLV